MCIWVLVVFDLTVVYVVRCQASTRTLRYTVFSSLASAPSAISLVPFCFCTLLKDQERYLGTNLRTTMMRMILYMKSSGLYFDTWMIFAFIDIYKYMYMYVCMYVCNFWRLSKERKGLCLIKLNISWINTLWFKKEMKKKKAEKTMTQKRDLT